MAAGFPNLSSLTILHWPEASNEPVTRDWYRPYAIALIALSTAVLVLRLWLQVKRSVTGLRADDCIIGIAWIFAVLYTVTTSLGTSASGFNRHMWDVSTELYSRAALIEWLSEGAFILSTCITKASILWFCCQLDLVLTTASKRIIRGLIAITAGYGCAIILAQVLLCHPTTTYWQIPGEDRPVRRSCGNQQPVYILDGLLDVLSTCYCALIPIFVLRKLPMPGSGRLSLCAGSVASLAVVGIAVARAVFLFRLTHSDNGDATWNAFNVFVVGQLECQLMLICASAPYLLQYAPPHPQPQVNYVYDDNTVRRASAVSRVSSSLSGQFKRLPFGRASSPRSMDISGPLPQAVPGQIPEWEFEFDILQTPPRVHSPVDDMSYHRYVAGRFGPPVPPKDTRELFEQYRREHGEIV